MRVALLAFAALATTAAAAEDNGFHFCQVCYAATSELRKRIPILSREASREDKEMSLYENGPGLPYYCDNFHGFFESPRKVSAHCQQFLSAYNSKKEIEEAVLSGGDEEAVCGPVCAGQPEIGRMPRYVAPPPGKGKVPTPGSDARKGTVDDPAYKAALMKKKKRDARRAKANAGGPEEEEL